VSRDPRLAPVDARIRQSVASTRGLSGGLYTWLRYHLGWDSDAVDAPRLAAGKGLRPLLCLTACAAVGGSEDSAVPAATALELTHEFSLIHDDIEDSDKTRRGRAALWTLSGLAQGVNAGDALWAIARLQLGQSPVADAVLVRMLGAYDRACVLLAEGQYMDLAFESREQVEPREYVAMVRRKTGALMAASAALGALAGGAEDPVRDAFWSFGEALGVAFQIQDDILGIWGDPEATGKPVGADLLRRKKTLPVVLALSDEDLSPVVRGLFRRGTPGAQDAARAAARLEQGGVRTRAAKAAQEHSSSALRALDNLDLAPDPRAELVELVDRAVAREQ
jgi:geranylgeranyl diphosphate synthase type I